MNYLSLTHLWRIPGLLPLLCARHLQLRQWFAWCAIFTLLCFLLHLLRRRVLILLFCGAHTTQAGFPFVVSLSSVKLAAALLRAFTSHRPIRTANDLARPFLCSSSFSRWAVGGSVEIRFMVSQSPLRCGLWPLRQTARVERVVGLPSLQNWKGPARNRYPTLFWNVLSLCTKFCAYVKQKSRASPAQTWIASGKLVGAYNFAASLFCLHKLYLVAVVDVVEDGSWKLAVPNL